MSLDGWKWEVAYSAAFGGRSKLHFGLVETYILDMNTQSHCKSEASQFLVAVAYKLNARFYIGLLLLICMRKNTEAMRHGFTVC